LDYRFYRKNKEIKRDVFITVTKLALYIIDNSEVLLSQWGT